MRPVYFFNPSYDERNINFQNLGLVSIASHLKRKGIPAYVYMNYLDERVTREKDYDLVLEDVIKQNPKYIGISCMTTQYEKALDLTERIRKLSRDVKIAWGGHHINAYYKEFWDDWEHWGKLINYLCVFKQDGWGEEWCEALWEGISFVDYGFQNNYIKSLSYPEEDHFDYPLDFSTVINYQPVERSMRGRLVKQASIMTSYGCPFSCRFCINAVQDKQVIYRDLESCAQEIKQVLSMGTNSIAFYDELFFVKNRVSELFEMLDVSFPWLALARINSPLKDLSYYRAKGCEEIHFGVESGSQRMIDERINKKIKIAQVIPTLQRVIDADILPRASFIIGMPGETIEDVSQTIWLMMEMAEKFGTRFVINGFFFYPIPGTPMTDEAFKGLSPQDCIDAARLSVHPYKLFEHFDRMYDWLPDKKFFAECWYIARVISELCAPYKYYESYKPEFRKWGLSVSDETYERLNKGDLSQKWLNKVRDY